MSDTQKLIGGGASGCGVHAEVEAHTMKSEDLRRGAQSPRPQFCNSRAGMFCEELFELRDIADELIQLRIGSFRSLQGSLQPPDHDPQLAPVEFARLVHFVESPCRGEPAHIPLQFLAHSLLKGWAAAGE